MTENKKRYHLLDAIRGVLVICMVVHHGMLSAYMATGNRAFNDAFESIHFLSPYFAGAFILISGLCCRFSRSNAKRGAQLFMIAAALTVVTVLADAWFDMGISIIFGILHLLAFCMLFVGAFNTVFQKINPYIGMAISAGLFICYLMIFAKDGLEYIQTNISWLFPFGWVQAGFFSADYWPIIPWMFIFMFGYFLGNTGIVEKNEKIFCAKPTRFLPFVGRHALIVYIVHQPVIFGAAYLMQVIING
ncbi:MAG: DUF1624 domain-containing protein [Oscillospiraceae bacterium]|nr:DUF1624 domain-containing protein [Candidatus Equicaccousia limihippi]